MYYILETKSYYNRIVFYFTSLDIHSKSSKANKWWSSEEWYHTILILINTSNYYYSGLQRFEGDNHQTTYCPLQLLL